MSAFDAYDESYRDVVQRSIAFSGLKHDLFLEAKARILADVFTHHFGEARPSLLDVGCGVGSLHPYLRPIVGDLGGCDPSAGSLAKAGTANAGVDYRAQEHEGLPWADASVDASLAVCVFHHVPPAERAALLGEMVRVTRPGGLVLVIEHNPWNPLTRLAVARCPFDDDAVLLGARECRERLRGAGLEQVESRHFLVVPSTGRWAKTIEAPIRRVPIGAQYLAYGTV